MSLLSLRRSVTRLPLLLVLSAFALLSAQAFASAASAPSVQLLPSISTIAGDGSSGFDGDNGPAISAAIGVPRGVAVDAAGNVYMTDISNYRVRKVDTSGNITTIAGNGFSGFTGDGGLAINAQLSEPEDVAVDAAGNVYIVDTEDGLVRRVDAATGIITTVAGIPSPCAAAGDGGPATAAQLCSPYGIDVDDAGNLYIADTFNNRVRKVDAVTGIITTVAGNGTSGFSGMAVLLPPRLCPHPSI